MQKKEEGININNLNIKIPSSGQVIFGIRPEHLFLKKEHALRVTKDTNFVEIEVKPELYEYVGHEQIITFNYLGQEILGKFSSSAEIEINKIMKLFIDMNSVSIFDSDTKIRI